MESVNAELSSLKESFSDFMSIINGINVSIIAWNCNEVQF